MRVVRAVWANKAQASKEKAVKELAAKAVRKARDKAVKARAASASKAAEALAKTIEGFLINIRFCLKSRKI